MILLTIVHETVSGFQHKTYPLSFTIIYNIIQTHKVIKAKYSSQTKTKIINFP